MMAAFAMRLATMTAEAVVVANPVSQLVGEYRGAAMPTPFKPRVRLGRTPPRA